MRIVSLNAFESPLSRTNARRLKKLTEELLRLRPDIICLQEIITAKTAHRLSRAFTAAGYATFCQPKRVFNHGGLWCATTLPVEAHSFVRFKNQGARVSLQLAERIIKKGYQCLTVRAVGTTLTVFNTHIASIFKRNSKKQLKTRMSHANQLVQAVAKTKGNPVLAGDCNFTPHDPEHRLMEKTAGLVDPLEIVYFPTVSPKNSNRKKSLIWPKYSVRHDYTWIARGLSRALRSQKIVFDKPYLLKKKLTHLSDHYGILTEFKW